MSKLGYLIKKNTPTILTVIGGIGVIGTTVLAVAATPKALMLIEMAEDEKGENLTPMEVVSVAWKPYVPAIAAGFGTIACIFGANFLNTRTQASLMSAYALLDASYKEYKEVVKKLHGDEEINVEKEIIKYRLNNSDIELEPGKLLFLDDISKQFFQTTMEDVLHVEHEYLNNMYSRGYVSLNEYYDLLGIKKVPYGYQMGWSNFESNDLYNCRELEFDYNEITIMDDLTCFLITTNQPPSFDYII